MLTEQLALEIVKRTMSILDENVNVMDRTGTIIASGDTGRIGQLHGGARKVIDESLTVEISLIEANHWSGARPGINLPIRFHDDVVGVIGITGEPELIRSFSKLVQMGAELTLEQAFLTREIDRNAKMRDDVISHLLLGSDKEEAYILDRAHALKINTDENFAIILISVPFKTTSEQLHKQIENWTKSLLRKEDEMVHLYTNQFLILKKQQVPYLDTDKKLKELIYKKLPHAPISNLTIALGAFSIGFRGWRQSFQTVQMIKETAETLYPEGGVWDQKELGISILCYQFLSKASEEADKISTIYQKLLHVSDGIALDDTFTTYVKENGEMAKTAEKLFIHRNTLAYRLDKIYEITGKNPKKLVDLIELKISQILYKLVVR